MGKVKLTTINKCFKHSGFVHRTSSRKKEVEVPVPSAFHDVPIPSNMTAEEFEQFVDVDADVGVFREIANADLLAAIGLSCREEEDEDEDFVPMTTKEEMEMLVQVKRFVVETGLPNSVLASLESEVHKQITGRKKQSKISYVFRKVQTTLVIQIS